MIWSSSHLLPDYVKNFHAYIPGRPDGELMKLYGCSRIIRLNNNENCLGPPGPAQEAIRSFPPPRGAIYPSGDAYYLRLKLGEKLHMDPDQFIVGNGANEVIGFVIKCYCQEGDNIITADRTFAVYEWVATFSGVEARLVPLKDNGFDGDEMLRQVDERTKIIFLCNPNNPTGSYWSRNKLRSFLDALDGRALMVVDEAYCEFVESEDYPDGLSLINEYPNLVIFRTFSKMYGLAGLRIGYLAGDLETVSDIRRTCIVYSVNAVAQVAAHAALDDDEHIERTRRIVREGKEFLEAELARMNLQVVSGEGNFLIAALPITDTLAYRKLMKSGVMVRTMTAFRFPHHIRVTIAQMDAMEAFVEGLKKALQ